nr:DEAD/DEAH box helicase [Cutibacterium avidum]
MLASPQVVHVDHRDAASGRTCEWPSWLPEDCRKAVEKAGISHPWEHQALLAELAKAGHHTAICTATASGKTLAYLLPIMAATASTTPVLPDPPTPNLSASLRDSLKRNSALYLAPTKALAHDQDRVCREIGPRNWLVSTLDGDSDDAERRFAREQARYVLTNPDMLHHTVLPSHSRWASLLGSLRYVVIDEAHRYRGVFGAHVAQVIRRLRRLCRMHGADPVFLLSSATSTNAAEAGARLLGVEKVDVVDEDCSPHPGRDVVLWQPAKSVSSDATGLVADLADAGMQTICFVASRSLAEVISAHAQDRVTGGARIASYRAGYLPEDRRAIEAGLQNGSVRAVVATNALELGVDVSGMDAVVIAGYPGRLSSLWQQAGRAGRSGRDALVVLMARENPLDQYLFNHPELLFSSSVESTVLHPDNPYVLGPHLAAAAQEAYLSPADEEFYGSAFAGMCEMLAAQKVLRRRGNRLFWTRPGRAVDAIDLRSAAGKGIDIIDRSTGRVIGVVDEAAGDRTVHPGAVYLHQGDQWLVDEYDPAEHHALVHQGLPGYVACGQVELTEQVVGYLRRDEITNDVWDSTALDMPTHTMITQACWWVIPDEVVDKLGLDAVHLAGAAHGCEHTAIGLLPMFSPCDRWDVGGVSTVMLPDTGACTIVIHDGQAGGAGFAQAGFDKAEEWWHATALRLAQCECESGCPACVVSPKCGNANQMLDKASAAALTAEMDPLGT